MNRFSAISCFCVLLVIAESRALTLSEAFPWINTGSPPIGQGLQEFEAQFPDATSRTEQPMTEMAKMNQHFMLDNQISVLFINGHISSLTYLVTGGNYEKYTRDYRSQLQKRYGKPTILETAQVNSEGVVHSIEVEEYKIDDTDNINAILMGTSRGFHIQLYDKTQFAEHNRQLLPSIEGARKDVKHLGYSPDGEKTIVDFVAKLRAEEAGEITDDATSDSEDVVIEEGIASQTASSESSPAPSAKKKFPTPLQIGGASAVIVVLAVVFAAKMRRPN